jgi:hypothetical protein
MSRFDDVRAALERLDNENDLHWMPDGTPRLDALVHLEPLPTREEINKFSVTRRKPEPVSDVVESAPTMTPDEARAAITEAESNLFAARQDVQRLASKQKIDRANAAQAIRDFALLWPRLSPEQNARQFIATGIAERAEVASQNASAPGHDVGIIQRQASATRGGSAGGKFNSWRRGADRTTPMRGQRLPSDR